MMLESSGDNNNNNSKEKKKNHNNNNNNNDDNDQASTDRRIACIPLLTRGALQCASSSYRAHVSTSHGVLHVAESEHSLPRSLKPEAVVGPKDCDAGMH